MIFGKSVIGLIIAAVVSICIFFLAQWLIPLLFGLVSVAIPGHIVNVLSLLIALGAFLYWWRGGLP